MLSQERSTPGVGLRTVVVQLAEKGSHFLTELSWKLTRERPAGFQQSLEINPYEYLSALVCQSVVAFSPLDWRLPVSTSRGLKGTPPLQLSHATRLGRYEILERIGSGGMGEIYRATDTRLQREVAIKRLPLEQAENSKRRLRFEREARLVSRLAHPNICSVYDVLDHGEATYMVMELLRGETLEERLRRGPLPDDELLKIAAELADALAAAHAAGIVHRDTKPSNIMLTAGGAKLLDFGIAKEPSRVDHEAQTLTGGRARFDAALTETGTTVGTLRYMSPEQLRGSHIGPPADVFAFGMVLYEMASGKAVFECETGAEWIASVLREPTPDLRAATDRPLARALAPIVERCCAKEPTARYADGGEIATAIRELMESEAGTATVERPSQRPPAARRWVWSAVLLSIVVLGFWFMQQARTPPASSALELRPVKRYEINLPAALPLHPASATDTVLAVSPDARNLVYVAFEGGRSHLVLRPLDQLDGRRLEGTENGLSPFFSPDGSAIGFFTRPGSRLKRLELADGSVRDLAPATLPLGGAWGPDGSIVFWSEFGKGLLRVPQQGGRIEELTQLDLGAGEQAHAYPSFLPDGSGVLYVAAGAESGDEIRSLDLVRGTNETLIRDRRLLRPQLTPTGHLIWARPGGLSVATFPRGTTNTALQPQRLEITDLAADEQVPSRFAMATDGSLLYVPASASRPPQERRLLWIDADGQSQPVPIPPAEFLHVRLAPSGEELVANFADLEEIWLFSLVDGAAQRLVGGGNLNFLPIWHPAGDRLLYTSNRDGTPNLYELELASGRSVRLAAAQEVQIADQFHLPTGDLFYIQRSPRNGSDIWRMRFTVDEEGQRTVDTEQVLATRFDEGYSAPSPDGELLAYVSDATGRYEVYVARTAGMQSRLQVTDTGAGSPIWAPDGRSLYYRSGNAVWQVEVQRQPRLALGAARMLFERHLYRNPTEVPQLQLALASPANQPRFLAIEDNQEPASATRLVVVEGWIREVIDLTQDAR